MVIDVEQSRISH